MSEICFECLNETLGGVEERKKYVYSKYPELCESCGEYKQIVVVRRDVHYYIRKFKLITYPLIIVSLPMILLCAPFIRMYWKARIKKRKGRKPKGVVGVSKSNSRYLL